MDGDHDSSSPTCASAGDLNDPSSSKNAPYVAIHPFRGFSISLPVASRGERCLNTSSGTPGGQQCIKLTLSVSESAGANNRVGDSDPIRCGHNQADRAVQGAVWFGRQKSRHHLLSRHPSKTPPFESRTSRESDSQSDSSAMSSCLGDLRLGRDGVSPRSHRRLISLIRSAPKP